MTPHTRGLPLPLPPHWQLQLQLQPLSPSQRQRGLSMLLLIALLVLLSSLGAFALRMLNTTASLASTELLALRAEQAASTGAQWQRLRLSGAAPSCMAATTLGIPFRSGDFPVTIRCNLTSQPAAGYSDGGPPLVRTYRYTAVACWPTAAACPVAPAALQPPDYVESRSSGIVICTGSVCH